MPFGVVLHIHDLILFMFCDIYIDYSLFPVRQCCVFDCSVFKDDFPCFGGGIVAVLCLSRKWMPAFSPVGKASTCFGVCPLELVILMNLEDLRGELR